MIKTFKKYIQHRVFSSPVKEKAAVEAYDLWAENYDSQPGNLMLDLDEIVFAKLLDNIDLKNKYVADIGCGTGRHWAKILQKNPESLTGFDVSTGMLDKLNEKFPSAETHVITDNNFATIADGTFDVILSTLTVAHLEDIEEALEAWCRILTDNGDIIITDFHPDALSFGGKRTFRHHNTQIAVRNFVHSTIAIKKIFARNNFDVGGEDERKIDEHVMHYYVNQNALPVYEKFKGFPIIYGIHFRRM